MSFEKVSPAPPPRRPERKCAACGQKGTKDSFLRVVRLPSGEVRIDATGKMPGRGVYLCHDPKCLRRARKSERLGHLLHVPVPPEIYDGLEATL